MAKFTKLNIGDAVASSSGRVWKKLSAESAEVQEELAGTWVFTSDLGVADDFYYTVGESVSVSFLSDSGRIFRSISFKEQHNTYGNSLWYGSTVVFENDGRAFASWTNNDYKTIEITSKLSEVTNGSALLTWLKTNATKQGTANLISFTIKGTEYQAEEGMTWEQWLSSEYNTGSYYTTASWIRKSNSNIVGLSVGNPVFAWNNISANTAYAIITTSGLGPEPS